MLNKLSVCSPDVVDTLYSSKSDLKHTTRFKKLFFKTRAMSVYYSCVYSSSLHFSRTFRTTEPTSLLQYTSHTHVVTRTQSHPALGMRMNGWSFSDRLMLKIQESVLKERCKVDPSSSGTKFYPCFWAMSIRQPYNPKQNKRMFLYFPEELGLSKALNTQTASEVNRNHALNISYPHFPPQVAKVQLSQQLNAYFGRKASRGWQTKLSTFWCSHALKTNKNWHLLLYTLTPPPGNAHNAPLHIHHGTKPHVVTSLCKVPSLLFWRVPCNPGSTNLALSFPESYQVLLRLSAFFSNPCLSTNLSAFTWLFNEWFLILTINKEEMHVLP